MKKYTGKSVVSGIAIGKIKVFEKRQQQIIRKKIEDTEQECKRFYEAKEQAKQQLHTLYEKAVKEAGEANAAIFEVHRMMLDDGGYCDSVTNIITSQKVNAEFAVAATSDNFSNMFESMEDEYMKARAADIKDISERVISNLKGEEKSIKQEDAAIILADDLAPSETVQLEKDKVLSFVTVHGSSNSHTAILARSMNIPSLISAPVPLSEELNGKTAIVDGFEGVLYIDPTSEFLQEKMQIQEKEQKKKELLKCMKGKETQTADGKKIKLYANIGNVADVAEVLKNDAAGIGLFRSEFIYLGKDQEPTEEEQFLVYKTVIENMAGKPVIIRTCDIGADKQADYFQMEPEENPAMGYRAIRICLDCPEMFKRQLRAIFRASVFGKVSIMYPMIISLDEVLQIKKIVEEVKKELEEKEIPYGEVKHGIMIETPAAVMISDLLAKEVDFFSIGSNDLTQYTLAIDRQNQKLDGSYDSHHPAVLKMIQMVIENAHKAGIWVGICGELGADLTLTETFLNMGMDEFSVTPAKILELRKKICASTIEKK